MEVENHLFIVEFMVFQGAILHFHVSSRECIPCSFFVSNSDFLQPVLQPTCDGLQPNSILVSEQMAQTP